MAEVSNVKWSYNTQSSITPNYRRQYHIPGPLYAQRFQPERTREKTDDPFVKKKKGGGGKY